MSRGVCSGQVAVDDLPALVEDTQSALIRCWGKVQGEARFCLALSDSSIPTPTSAFFSAGSGGAAPPEASQWSRGISCVSGEQSRVCFPDCPLECLWSQLAVSQAGGWPSTACPLPACPPLVFAA